MIRFYFFKNSSFEDFFKKLAKTDLT